MHMATSGTMCVDSGLRKALQTVHPSSVHIIFKPRGFKCQDKSLACALEFAIIVRNQLHITQVPVTSRDNPQALDVCVSMSQGQNSCGFCVDSEGVSGLSVVPVLTQPVLPQPPLALGLVLVQELRRRQSRLLELVARLVVLPRVPLALAGGDHSDFVRSRAAVLTLQLDALGAGFVVDTAPVLVAAPATPQLPAVGAADPVLKHLSWETLAGAHQLLDGVDAGAVAIRDVLSGPQLSASDLAPFASVVRSAGRSSPSGPCAVQGHVTLNLRHRRAHVREQELRGVVLEGMATPQEDAKYDQGMARLVRAQVHGCSLGMEGGGREM